MPKAGLAYERPSRTSLALIIGFSLAVVAMTGWLVLLIMFSPDANTMTATASLPSRPSELPATPGPPGPPRVETLPTDNQFPLTRTVRPVPATRPASPWGDSIASIPALPAAPMTTPAAAPAAPREAPVPPDRYTPSSVGTVDTDYRGAAADYVNAPGTGEIDTAHIPLPHPRPRHLASIPVPRPRPQIDEPEAPQEKSFFDLLIDRQR